jgi:hypothetical protein
MNAGMVLSMGGFFTLMAIGLASRLPSSLYSGLTSAGVTPDAARQISHVPPVGTLFAAFLGDNPIEQLMRQVDPAQLQPGSGVDVQRLTGTTFFPHLISGPFMHGLLIAFGASIVMLVVAAAASLMRGERFVHDEAHGVAGATAEGQHHESVGEALAHEGESLAVPALLEDTGRARG